MSESTDLAVTTTPPPNMIVVDTNVVLDLFVFLDPSASRVGTAALSSRWQWIGSHAMRDELEQVLAYAAITARLACCNATATQVLAQYEARVRRVAPAPRAGAICKDPDDQKFIDLAVHHGAILVSKDKAVLALKKRLAQLGVRALTAQEFEA